MAQWMYLQKIPLDFEIIKFVVNKTIINEYNFYSPPLTSTTKSINGQMERTLSVIGGVSAEVNLKHFAKP